LAQLLRPRDVSHKIVNLKACFDGIEDQLASRTWIVGRNVFSEIQQLSGNYAEREQEPVFRSTGLLPTLDLATGL